MGREVVVCAVAGEEGHGDLFVGCCGGGVVEDGYRGGGGAPGGGGREGGDVGEVWEGGEAGAAYYCYVDGICSTVLAMGRGGGGDLKCCVGNVRSRTVVVICYVRHLWMACVDGFIEVSLVR